MSAELSWLLNRITFASVLGMLSWSYGHYEPVVGRRDILALIRELGMQICFVSCFSSQKYSIQSKTTAVMV